MERNESSTLSGVIRRGVAVVKVCWDESRHAPRTKRMNRGMVANRYLISRLWSGDVLVEQIEDEAPGE